MSKTMYIVTKDLCLFNHIMKNIVFVLTGATASGKSEIAMQLAEYYDPVIINCDSKQVYMEIPIITAQPVDKDLQNIEHNLYGYVSAKEHYSVAQWLKDVEVCINSAVNRNKMPVIVGGTGFYIESMIKGLPSVPKISDYVCKIVALMSQKQLHEFLYLNDNLALQKIELNDLYRIRRAVEVFMQSGKSLFTFDNRVGLGDKFKFITCVINRNRNQLYDLINKRVLKMLDDGVIDEIMLLKKLSLNKKSPALLSCGILEFFNYLNEEISLQEAINLVQQRTRNYAKRQESWFHNRMKDAHSVSTVSDIIKLI